MRIIKCPNCWNEIAYDEKKDYEIRCNNCWEVYCNEEAK